MGMGKKMEKATSFLVGLVGIVFLTVAGLIITAVVDWYLSNY